MSTKVKRRGPARKGAGADAAPPGRPANGDARTAAILRGAFEAFLEHGVSGATTDEIARRARVSKREIYRLFGSKEELFARLVHTRAVAMQRALTLAPAADRAAALDTLQRFGREFLALLTDPTSVAVYRLAIGEASRLPALGRELDAHGRTPVWTALREWLGEASERGVLAVPDVERAGGSFMALLMADLPVRLMLGVAATPSAEEIERRAALATAGFARLWLG